MSEISAARSMVRRPCCTCSGQLRVRRVDHGPAIRHPNIPWLRTCCGSLSHFGSSSPDQVGPSFTGDLQPWATSGSPQKRRAIDFPTAIECIADKALTPSERNHFNYASTTRRQRQTLWQVTSIGTLLRSQQALHRRTISGGPRTTAVAWSIDVITGAGRGAGSVVRRTGRRRRALDRTGTVHTPVPCRRPSR
jgi:hypothetical protein